MGKQDSSIQELVNKIDRGELVLPEMQRQYVWTGIKVRDLLDSLYRKYPSGTILIWETNEEAPSRELGVEQEKSPLKRKLLLLDGQQRLTSLTAIITGKQIRVKDSKKPIEIMFNLQHPEGLTEDQEILDEDDEVDMDDDDLDGSEQSEVEEYLSKRTFVVSAKILEGNPNWVSVTDIFQKTTNKILTSLNIQSSDDRWDKYSERIDNVRKIKDYPYVVHILGPEYDYNEVTEIFVRVNSLGASLRSSDLALAQITAKWPGSLKILEDYAKDCAEDGHDIDLGLLVRTLVIFATNQSRFKTVGTLKREKLIKAWEKTKKGLDYSLNFISKNTKLEDINLLSSAFIAIPIAVLAQERDEKLSRIEERTLSRWIYLSHSFGHYSRGSSESILDADINIILKKKNPLDEMMTILERQTGRLEFNDADLIGKWKRSPLFNMAYLAIKQNDGKDWFTGIALSFNNRGKSHKIEFHHIFPKKVLQDAGYGQKEINEIANIAFIGGKTNRRILAKKPKDYLAEIVEKRGEEALASQFVPLDRKLWEVENYLGFINARRSLLIGAINKFLK